jgi:transposase
LRDLYTKLANGHLEKDIGALMPWAYAAEISSQTSSPGTP